MKIIDEEFTFLNLPFEINEMGHTLKEFVSIDTVLVRTVYGIVLKDQEYRNRLNAHFERVYKNTGPVLKDDDEVYLLFYSGLYRWHLDNEPQFRPVLKQFEITTAAELERNLAFIGAHLRSTPISFKDYLLGFKLQPVRKKVAISTLKEVLNYFVQTRNEKRIAIVQLIFQTIEELRKAAYQE